MLDELRKLIKHTGIYGTGTILGKLVGFFMIPFYTHYLTPADYGTLELLDLSLTLVALVLTTWMHTAVVRYYHDSDNLEDRNKAVSTILIFAAFLGLIAGGLGICFSRSLSLLILNTADLHRCMAVISVSLFVSSINMVCLSYLRAQQKSSLVVSAGLVSMVLSLTLNIYFIAVRHTGVIGVLYSSLISSSLVTAVLAANTIRNVSFVFSSEKLHRMVAFGAPLIATAIAAFAVNFSDRFFLRHFTSVSDVGIYALGYKFGFMLSMLLVQPFDMIWQARIYEIEKRAKSGYIFSKVFEYYCFVLIAAALVLSLVIRQLIPVIAAPSFHAAYKVVPIVALAYIFQGTNRFFLTGAYIAKKSTHLGVVGLISAAINLGLNFLLIPRYGMLGAGWATAFSFLLMSIMACIVSQKVYPIPYVFSRVIMFGILAALTYIASGLISVSSPILQLSIKVLLLLMMPVLLYVLGFFNSEEIKNLRTIYQGALARYRLLTATEPGR